MIGKILITLAVIMACLWVLSNRANPKLREVPNPAVELRKKHMRLAAYAFMAVMVVAAGVMIYLELEARGN